MLFFRLVQSLCKKDDKKETAIELTDNQVKLGYLEEVKNELNQENANN